MFHLRRQVQVPLFEHLTIVFFFFPNNYLELIRIETQNADREETVKKHLREQGASNLGFTN